MKKSEFDPMNLNPVLQTLTTLPGRLKQRAQGMFNLNDPRWGRDDDKPSSDDAKPEAPREDKQPPGKPTVRKGRGPTRARPTWTNSGATSTASWAAFSAATRTTPIAAASAAAMAAETTAAAAAAFSPT
jgi:hypothetical protein